MATIVLSIGGSMIFPENADVEFVKKLAGILVKASEKHRIGVVCGGGRSARVYANAVRELGGNEFYADSAGVLSTRQNAMLLLVALGEKAYPKVISDFDHVPDSEKIVVMGGTIPGITTDGDTALLGELMKADRIINLSNVDGIYDKDPRKFKDAKKFESMTHREMVELATLQDKRTAGENFVFDIYACKIIARSNLETHFVNGKKLEEVEKAIEGKRHGGTVVKN